MPECGDFSYNLISYEEMQGWKRLSAGTITQAELSRVRTCLKTFPIEPTMVFERNLTLEAIYTKGSQKFLRFGDLNIAHVDIIVALDEAGRVTGSLTLTQ